MRLRSCAALVDAIVATLLLSSSAAAQSTEASRPSFVHRAFTVADGLPVNAITALAQTRDGYLWASTWDGLVRFDGVRFTVFNTANAPGLRSNRLLALQTTGDGSLWTLTEAAQLVRFRDGGFTIVEVPTGVGLRLEKRPVFEDARGGLWLDTSWKTEKSWANSCRELTVMFTQGGPQKARFRFTR